MQERKFNISTVNMMQALTKQPTVNNILVEDLQYTVLDHNRVVYRDSMELAELHAINDKIPPKEYVAYRPERMILHESIAAVSIQLQLFDEKEMQKVTREISEAAIAELSAFSLERRRASLQIHCDDLITRYLAGDDICGEEDGEKIIEICEQIKSCPAKFGQYIPGYTAKHAMLARATDILFTEKTQDIITYLVQEQIDARTDLKRLIIPEHNARYTFMVNGGPASGKGSSVANIVASAADVGIDWNNVVKINTDSYKPLLLEPGSVKPELYSQLAQEEAATVHQLVQKRLTAMAENKQAPHTFIDQVFPGTDKLRYGLIQGGCVRGIVVSTEVADALTRSCERGEEDGALGRYESTEGLLRLHKASTEQLPSNLAQFPGENIQFSVVDNNVPYGEQATQFMTIDMLEKKINITSPEKLNHFVKKTSIRPDAKYDQQLYNATVMDDLSYMHPLINIGMAMQVVPPLMTSETAISSKQI